MPITQSYDPAGRPLRLAYPNGLDADLSFETATGRLASITHRAGSLSSPIAQFNHAYDIRGDLATLTELNSGTKSFAYDAIERLGAVTQTLPLPATQIEAYAYDTEGNRVASHISPAYVTDAANHVLDDGTNTYTWTPDGGMASRTPNADAAAGVTFQYSWQGTLNQLRLEAVGGAYPISFMYDGLLRNIGRNFADPTRGLVVEHHDGPDIALELRNYFAGSGSQWVRYVHGPGVDQPLALEIYPQGSAPTPGTGAQYYFHADGEGSIRLLTDANAQIANQYSYNSYGQRLTAVESVPQPYGWKGRDFIPGPNIYYNRARFYDPVLGRFTTEDPLGYGGDDWNFYSFGHTNPRNWSDPSGLQSQSAILPQGGPAAEYAALAAVTAAALVSTLPKIACGIDTQFAKVYLALDGYTDIQASANCSASGFPPLSTSALPFNLINAKTTHDPNNNSCDSIANNSDYYTYTIYTKAGVPIYVGKGTGGRVWDTLRNKLAQAGGYVSCLAASDEQDAYELECAEILALGGFKSLNPASPLVNILSPRGTNCRQRQITFIQASGG